MGSAILILLPSFHEKFYLFFYTYFKPRLLKMFKFKFKY